MVDKVEDEPDPEINTSVEILGKGLKTFGNPPQKNNPLRKPTSDAYDNSTPLSTAAKAHRSDNNGKITKADFVRKCLMMLQGNLGQFLTLKGLTNNMDPTSDVKIKNWGSPLGGGG